MRRVLAAAFALLSVGCLSGCGGGPTVTSIGGGPTSNPAPLNGHYAFLLSGFDSIGNTMVMAGSFTADGNGHISAGDVDINDNEQTTVSGSALAGTYTLNTLGQGTITFTTVVGSLHSLTFSIALRSDGTSGDIMDTSANNYVISGTLQQQTVSVFSLGALAKSWIVTANGRFGASSMTAALGRFTLSAGGVGSGISFDRSVANQGTSGPTTGGSTSLSITTPDANGRGTLSVSISDGIANTSQTFTYYAISASHFIAAETDTGGTMMANATAQGSLTASSVNTTGSVFALSGTDTAATNEISSIGQLVVATASTATFVFDSNDNGGIVPNVSLTSSALAFDTTTNVGRGTITVPSGTADGLANTFVFYLSSTGNGALLDATNTTSNRAMVGPLTAQTGSPFSINTDFAANAVFRGNGASVNDAGIFVGLFEPSISTLTGIQRFPSTTTITTQSVTINSLTASLTASTGSLTGRGQLLTGSETLTFYIIGPNQFVFINTTATEGSSPLFFVDPQ